MTPHEERTVRDRERRAAKKAAAEAWKTQVDAQFRYLRERYGFALTRVDSLVWRTSVEYTTEQTAVGVARGLEFSGVEVWLQRKPDWILPGQPVYTAMNLTHERVHIGLLVRLRAPHLQPELATTIGLNDDVIEKRLALCAQILREFGDDLLRGDFSQLGAQRATMFDDVPPRAPVVTLWVPEASDREQRETWAKEVGSAHQALGLSRGLTRHSPHPSARPTRSEAPLPCERHGRPR